jgi:hypothetical protein
MVKINLYLMRIDLEPIDIIGCCLSSLFQTQFTQVFYICQAFTKSFNAEIDSKLMSLAEKIFKT